MFEAIEQLLRDHMSITDGSMTTNFFFKRYAIEHMLHDHLIVGFPSEKANPFREKTWSCEVL